MAGGPNAAAAPCLKCGARADRVREGLETDAYACGTCGARFSITFDEDAGGTMPTAPLWPPEARRVPGEP
jgi:hypothetical protein